MSRALVSRDMPTSQVGQATKLAVISKRLKGTYVRNFKKAAARLEEAVRIVAGHINSGKESQRLNALNKRLSHEVEELRANITTLRAEKNAAQAKMDGVLYENRRLHREVDALHEELKDIRRELTTVKMARLEVPPPAASTSARRQEPIKSNAQARPIPSQARISSAKRGALCHCHLEGTEVRVAVTNGNDRQQEPLVWLSNHQLNRWASGT